MRFLAILLFLLPFDLLADRIVLKDGKQYSGTFVDADGRQVKFRTSGRVVRTFRAADIQRLEISSKQAGSDADGSPAQPTQAQADRSMPARTPRQTPPQTAAQPVNVPPGPPLTTPDFTTGRTTPLDSTGAIDTEYTHMRSETGPLGPPRAPEQPTADGTAAVRFFAYGAIYWTPDAGAHAIVGPVFQAWVAQGGERSKLGYPTTDEDVTDAGSTRSQGFQGGRITWTQWQGASVVYSGR